MCAMCLIIILLTLIYYFRILFTLLTFDYLIQRILWFNLCTVLPSPEARRNLMKLAQRMIRTFCVNISSSSGLMWTALSDSPDDTVRITTRKISEPGQPNGLILCAVSTTWLPYPHGHVFDLLRDERRRSQVRSLQQQQALQTVTLSLFYTPI